MSQESKKQQQSEAVSAEVPNPAVTQEPFESPWQIQEGVMVSVNADPKEVITYLRELNVVAELDWFPRTSHLLGINLLKTEADGVAALDSEDASLRVGCTIPEIAAALAEHFRADVRIGVHHSNGLPDGAILPKVPDKSEIITRVVEITQMPASSVPFCAAAENRTMGCLELFEDWRAVCYETTAEHVIEGALVSRIPGIGLYVSQNDQRAVAVLNSEIADPEALSVHSWAMQTKVVAGAVAYPSNKLVGELRLALGHKKAPTNIAQMLGKDPAALDHSFKISGQDGMVAAIQALGLPNSLSKFLYQQIELEEIPGSHVFHEPGWTKALGASVGIRAHDSQRSPKKTKVLPLVWSYRLAAKYPILLRSSCIVEALIGTSLFGTGFYRLWNGRRFGRLQILAGLFLAAHSAIRAAIDRAIAPFVGELKEHE